MSVTLRHQPHSRLGRLAACAAAVALACLASPEAPAREVAGPRIIGVLTEALAATHPTVEGLKTGLRELGVEEGRDVAFDIRFSLGDNEALRTSAQAFASAGVDLIFTISDAATRSAQVATSTIPIVFTLVRDPVAASFVDSLAAPGGNLTGVSGLTAELAGKRLEILKNLAPDARRVWAIHDGDDPVSAAAVANARTAADQLGLQLVSRPVGTKDALTGALLEIRPGDAILAPDGGRLEIAPALLETSLVTGVPAVFPAALYVGYGGLVSYGPDFYAEGFQAARQVERILRGVRPRDLPVESADKIDLAINLNTAQQLGLAVPRKVLLRADTIRR
jgi:putative ABC transport system substrate-binding protein